MEYSYIEGLSKPISKIVLGSTFNKGVADYEHSACMYDSYYQSGGNTIDTAFIYGEMDAFIGRWLGDIRDNMVLIVKGAHTPNCNPEGIVKELELSLNNLKTDYADIYLIHRDNLDIPACDFIDVLNDLKNSGKIKVFGVSNWTMDRIDEANRYARDNDKTPIKAVSNNFSLATSVKITCEGGISSTSLEWRQWFSKSGIPNFSWSSLANGYFNYEDNCEFLLNSYWDCKENREKRKRVKILAGEKSVTPTEILLAYNLKQDFLVYSIISASNSSHLKTALNAFKVELTKDELLWLDLIK